MDAEIQTQLEHWLPGWTIFVSAAQNRDGSEAPGTGGMVLAFCPQLSLVATFANTVLVHGRCIGTKISYRDKILTVVNIHNYGLSPTEIHRIGNYLSESAQNVSISPVNQFSIFVGDLNIKAEDEKCFKAGRNLEGILARSASNPVFSGPHHNLWAPILSDWTELVQPFPTRYDPVSKTCSRIDRAFVFCPASMLLKLQTNTFVQSSPEDFYADEHSDHAPWRYANMLVPICSRLALQTGTTYRMVG
mgnify:CR=1 FL=1